MRGMPNFANLFDARFFDFEMFRNANPQQKAIAFISGFAVIGGLYWYQTEHFPWHLPYTDEDKQFMIEHRRKLKNKSNSE
eukprot:CAMPEP_0117049432 /NCGR_PEP_ID=MMETSP0472-20121206/34130_1 /TAXON_ID=693140 ORGANISM="Tiarina fusus, Strain LIS" /NCGR_SAMPLE_ID=MMETSP0472 /ASSEMBLY_ACC=CAM_ASM_000603 /LENGTH=79 /DNA_ID=CAMNT_0004762831 /DNA_START=25 /DNA_END=264 /DNA_ORIENTATION=-